MPLLLDRLSGMGPRGKMACWRHGGQGSYVGLTVLSSVFPFTCYPGYKPKVNLTASSLSLLLKGPLHSTSSMSHLFMPPSQSLASSQPLLLLALILLVSPLPPSSSSTPLRSASATPLLKIAEGLPTPPKLPGETFQGLSYVAMGYQSHLTSLYFQLSAWLPGCILLGYESNLVLEHVLFGPWTFQTSEIFTYKSRSSFYFS